MRVLLVKLSSLGDVIHNMPVVSDLARARPDIEVHWLTEAPYVRLLSLHPGVNMPLQLRLRQLKKRWWSVTAWRDYGADHDQVLTEQYDGVLDTQGLVKSAWVARWARAPISGYDADSVREPLAARFYDRRFKVSRELHAVVRNRELAAQAFNYSLPEKFDYGLVGAKITRGTAPTILPTGSFAVFLHATSRANKMWPTDHWIALGRKVCATGRKIVLLWGNEAERGLSEHLASALPDAVVPPPLTLLDAADLLAHANAVVGVDTGLAHLAVALKRPTVGVYCTTSPRLTGLYDGGADIAVNIGQGSPEKPDCPSVDEVWDAVSPRLRGEAS